MTKTKEEQNEPKKEVEAVGEKLRELSDEELEQVTGGGSDIDAPDVTVRRASKYDIPSVPGDRV